MRFSSLLKKLFCTAAALGLAHAGAPHGVAQTNAGNDLVERSPFMPEGWSPPRPPAPPRPPPQAQQQRPLDRMEFRGIARINGEPSFSLYDPTNQRSYWLRLNQPDSGFTVTEYKPREDAVVVRHEGQARTISLHEARVQAMATPPPTPQGQGVAPGTEQAQATTPEARMQDLAEEIRRRREIRRALVEGTQQAPAQDAPVPPDGVPPIPQ